MSKTINSQDFNDTLAQYGIGYLTAEACNYNMRIRFDVSAFGLKVFEEAFSISIDRQEQMRNMNGTVSVRGVSRDDQVPAEYGVMMTSKQAYEVLLFALVNDRLNEVVVPFTPKQSHKHYIAMPFIWIGTMDEWIDFRKELEEGGEHQFLSENLHYRVFAQDSNHPHDGSLNIHYMSGRSR